MDCPSCHRAVLDIDVKCAHCGAVLAATGAHRLVGTFVLGQYEITDVLGQGGMSVVYKGRHKLTEQDVALKILPPELAAHSQVKSRFLDEAKALAQLDHHNIVHLYNFGQENGCFVLAMQFVAGETWERMILSATRLDWQTSCRIAADVLRALEYAHGRGIIHRDMKPSNVLVRASDGAATVMDFGIAKMTTSTKLTATGQTMGTVRYMSPEQVRGQEVDLRTDLYSLGATLYESLVGDTPFDGSTHFEIMTKHLSEVPKRPSALGVELPLAVEDALMRSLAKRADDRQSTARELRKVLEAAVRESDTGLASTQRVGREHIRTTSPPPQARVVAMAPSIPPSGKQPAPRLSTAAELADELEPQTRKATSPRRRSLAPWLALAVVVLGGGAAAAILATRSTHPHRAAPVPHFTVPGVTISSMAATSSKPPVTVGAVKDIDVGAVATAYTSALAELRAFATDRKLGIVIADPVNEIYAVPRTALCDKSLYADHVMLDKCDHADSVVVETHPGVLLVVADPQRLPAAMREGVARAACLNGVPPDSDAICNLVAAFLEQPEHAPGDPSATSGSAH